MLKQVRVCEGCENVCGNLERQTLAGVQEDLTKNKKDIGELESRKRCKNGLSARTPGYGVLDFRRMKSHALRKRTYR